MTEGALQGERQEQIMIVLWHNGEGCVEHVRAGLPARHRGAYSTVQTVPNRLVDRGLPTRERRGKTFVYTAQMTEGQYLSRSIERTLAGASLEARQAALAQLIGTIGTDELSALRRLPPCDHRRQRRPADPRRLPGRDPRDDTAGERGSSLVNSLFLRGAVCFFER